MTFVLCRQYQKDGLTIVSEYKIRNRRFKIRLNVIQKEKHEIQKLWCV